MVYMGGKGRVAADILPIILNGRTEDQVYIEPFCGGLNMIDKVANPRIANDKNVYLIEMWKALQQGMRFPWDISREHYVACREAMRENSGRFTAAEIGWVGFMASFRGKFYEGYCGKNGGRKNVEEHIKNVMKQLPLINGIEFHSGEYSELSPPPNSIIYCDPPYCSTTNYRHVTSFDHNAFYDWCREQSKENKVFISEYSMPSDFVCIWAKSVQNAMGSKGKDTAVERLFVHESIVEDLLEQKKETTLFG